MLSRKLAVPVVSEAPRFTMFTHKLGERDGGFIMVNRDNIQPLVRAASSSIKA
ncbi:MAG TPA: hypothetical protein GXZ32_06085 [Clostridiales bacterium]|nr:hypothetical protein [Clostridiales bacterium]